MPKDAYVTFSRTHQRHLEQAIDAVRSNNREGYVPTEDLGWWCGFARDLGGVYFLQIENFVQQIMALVTSDVLEGRTPAAALVPPRKIFNDAFEDIPVASPSAVSRQGSKEWYVNYIARLRLSPQQRQEILDVLRADRNRQVARRLESEFSARL